MLLYSIGCQHSEKSTSSNSPARAINALPEPPSSTGSCRAMPLSWLSPDEVRFDTAHIALYSEPSSSRLLHNSSAEWYSSKRVSAYCHICSLMRMILSRCRSISLDNSSMLHDWCPTFLSEASVWPAAPAVLRCVAAPPPEYQTPDDGEGRAGRSR
jgi:hypothetical protein